MIRGERIHRRNMLSCIPELAVRAVLNDQKTMLTGKTGQHFPFLQRQGLPRRILEIRNHVQELDLLALSLDLGDCVLIGLTENIDIVIMDDSYDLGTV